MAEQKKPSAFDGVGGKTTPVLIDKLPKEVQDAFYRQMVRQQRTDEGYAQAHTPGFTSKRTGVDVQPRSLGLEPSEFHAQSTLGGTYPSVRGAHFADLPSSPARAARDLELIRSAGLTGRTVLWSTGDKNFRGAVQVDSNGGMTRAATVTGGSIGYPHHTDVVESGGSTVSGAHVRYPQGTASVEGAPRGAIRLAQQGVKLPPKMTARGMSILDAGPAMYQLMTDNVDTDFTVKMIPPQFRKPDETGKMREAVVIVDGQPFVQYEGEAFNIPGFEDVGDELASYFREHSSEAMGKNKLGADVAGTSMEVRESEQQAMDKKVQAGAQEAAGSTGPRKGGAPTFAGEYQVGRKSAEPRLPKTDEVLRKMN